MKRCKDQVKDFLLLVNTFTYLPLPQRVRADSARLARSLRFLPLLGTLVGGLLYACIRLLPVMPLPSAAALMLGVDLLSGGAYLLRDLMAVAGNTATRYEPEHPVDMDLPRPTLTDNEAEIEDQQHRFRVSRVGLAWGLVWLAAIFFSYYYLLTCTAGQQLGVVAAPVSSRLFMCWMIHYFPALAPGEWRLGLSRRGFAVAIVASGLVLLPMSQPVLFAGLVVSLAGVYLFAQSRVRYLGALDRSSYSAAAAWAQVLFLLTWVAYIRFF